MSIGKRNIFLGILALGVIVAAIILKTDGQPQHIFSQPTQNLLVAESVRSDTNIDSDDDGVPDWKESVLGTDSQNPNTFNTEGGDSAYILNINETEGIIGNQNFTSSDNLTEQVSRGTFGEYILLQQNKNSTAYSSPEDLAEAITAKALTSLQQTRYTKNDFSVVNTNRSTLLAYTDALRTIERKYPSSEFANLFQVITETFSDNPDKKIPEETIDTNIRTYLDAYTNVTAEMLIIPVPDIILNEHINLTNSLSGMQFSLEQITAVNTDPLRALLGIQLLSEYDLLIINSYRTIEHKLFLENIPL